MQLLSVLFFIAFWEFCWRTTSSTELKWSVKYLNYLTPCTSFVFKQVWPECCFLCFFIPFQNLSIAMWALMSRGITAASPNTAMFGMFGLCLPTPRIDLMRFSWVVVIYCCPSVHWWPTDTISMKKATEQPLPVDFVRNCMDMAKVLAEFLFLYNMKITRDSRFVKCPQNDIESRFVKPKWTVQIA